MMENIVAGLISGGGMAGLLFMLLKGKLDDLRMLERDLESFRVKVAEQYVTVKSMSELKSDMDKRFDKLERMLQDK